MSKRKELETKVLGRLLDFYVNGEAPLQEDVELSLRKPNGYWKSVDNTKTETRKAMQEQGWTELPNIRILRKSGYSDLVSAISVHHGGFHKFRVILGQENKIAPKGYLTVHKNIQFEAKRIMEKEGWAELPSGRTLQKRGHGSFLHAVDVHHGGLPALRNFLDQNRLNKPHGAWKSLDYTQAEARRAMQEEGWKKLPGANLLARKNYSSLSRSITVYHGGFHKFRRSLGQRELQRPYGYWMNVENAKKEALRAMEEQGWDELPNDKSLNKHGYSSLTRAIGKYHKGMRAFRKILEQKQKRERVGDWKDLTFTFEKARKAMQEQGWVELPSGNVVSDRGYGGLISAIEKYHGGINYFRQLLEERMTGRTEAQKLGSLLEQYATSGDNKDE